MYAKKAGASLNVIKEEGQIVIDTIKAELPATFRMVEQASQNAKKFGYVIINDRTNSRAWFPNLIKLLKGQITEKDNFMIISEEMSAARNIRIQGTQADFVKEATVVLKKYFVKNNLNVQILSWIHDELVFRIPKNLDGVSDKWKAHKENVSLYSPLTGNTHDNVVSVIKEIMEEVANRYLVNVKIKVDVNVEPYWTK